MEFFNQTINLDLSSLISSLSPPPPPLSLPPLTLTAIHINHEEYRLRTFRSWPIQAPISAERLAKAGFYYLGNSNLEVVCFSCQGKLSNWTFGDCAMEKHRLAFPECDFVNHRSNNVPFIPPNNNIFPHLTPIICSNISSNRGIDEVGFRHILLPNSRPERVPVPPASEIIISHSQPCYPSLVTLGTRLKTFKYWPKFINFIKFEDFAEAGFFYTGESDHVKCFYCNGGLKDWQPGDDPWIEHARLYPTCYFVKLSKGQHFIDEALTTTTTTTQPQSVNRSNLDLQVETIMKTNVVQAFLQSKTYPEHVVRLAILHHVSSGKKMDINVDTLCDMIHDYRIRQYSESEEEIRHFSSASSFSSSAASHNISGNENSRLTTIPPPVNQNLEIATTTTITTTTKPGQEDDVDEKIQSLLERTICKICLDNEVCVVFLPCGHLISCVQCALALTHCALCRCKIQSTLKTYLS